MIGKKWFNSKTMIFNIVMVLLYGGLFLSHPRPQDLHIESLVAATTAITNIFLRLQTKEPIK